MAAGSAKLERERGLGVGRLCDRSQILDKKAEGRSRSSGTRPAFCFIVQYLRSVAEAADAQTAFAFEPGAASRQLAQSDGRLEDHLSQGDRLSEPRAAGAVHAHQQLVFPGRRGRQPMNVPQGLSGLP
jgi:hypothetical protein